MHDVVPHLLLQPRPHAVGDSHLAAIAKDDSKKEGRRRRQRLS